MNPKKVLGALRRSALTSLYRRPALLSPSGPWVTICFDDFPRSAYRTGGAILSAFGYRATYYASAGLMNTTNDLGEQFNRADLESLVKDGHELASHTYGHVSCYEKTLRIFDEEIRRGRQALTDVVGPVVSRNFAYPFGEVSFATKRAIAAVMRSCRGTCGGLNARQPDLSLLRANGLYGGASQFQRSKQLIVANREAKRWLIFYTHDVRDNHSRFGCTAELLRATLACAIDEGSQILTVEEVLRHVVEEPIARQVV